MNYKFLDTEDLETLERCTLKQKMEENMIKNTIHFGANNLLGEFILDVKFAQMQLEKMLT